MSTSSGNTLRLRRIAPARRGSKLGWPTVTGQIPPDTFAVLEQIAFEESKVYGDLVHEAVALLIANRKAA